ncbi:hypothetical protein B0H12DRAFT_1102781 [Mycena haematopus]|nr:hypothetical protein B0H12DRAFT_1102781 [Mycena haematopus]
MRRGHDSLQHAPSTQSQRSRRVAERWRRPVGSMELREVVRRSARFRASRQVNPTSRNAYVARTLRHFKSESNSVQRIESSLALAAMIQWSMSVQRPRMKRRISTGGHKSPLFMFSGAT